MKHEQVERSARACALSTLPVNELADHLQPSESSGGTLSLLLTPSQQPHPDRSVPVSEEVPALPA